MSKMKLLTLRFFTILFQSFGVAILFSSATDAGFSEDGGSIVSEDSSNKIRSFNIDEFAVENAKPLHEIFFNSRNEEQNSQSHRNPRRVSENNGYKLNPENLSFRFPQKLVEHLIRNGHIRRARHSGNYFINFKDLQSLLIQNKDQLSSPSKDVKLIASLENIDVRLRSAPKYESQRQDIFVDTLSGDNEYSIPIERTDFPDVPGTSFFLSETESYEEPTTLSWKLKNTRDLRTTIDTTTYPTESASFRSFDGSERFIPKIYVNNEPHEYDEEVLESLTTFRVPTTETKTKPTSSVKYVPNPRITLETLMDYKPLTQILSYDTHFEEKNNFFKGGSTVQSEPLLFQNDGMFTEPTSINEHNVYIVAEVDDSNTILKNSNPVPSILDKINSNELPTESNPGMKTRRPSIIPVLALPEENSDSNFIPYGTTSKDQYSSSEELKRLTRPNSYNAQGRLPSKSVNTLRSSELPSQQIEIRASSSDRNSITELLNRIQTELYGEILTTPLEVEETTTNDPDITSLIIQLPDNEPNLSFEVKKQDEIDEAMEEITLESPNVDNSKDANSFPPIGILFADDEKSDDSDSVISEMNKKIFDQLFSEESSISSNKNSNEYKSPKLPQTPTTERPLMSLTEQSDIALSPMPTDNHISMSQNLFELLAEIDFDEYNNDYRNKKFSVEKELLTPTAKTNAMIKKIYDQRLKESEEKMVFGIHKTILDQQLLHDNSNEKSTTLVPPQTTAMSDGSPTTYDYTNEESEHILPTPDILLLLSDENTSSENNKNPENIFDSNSVPTINYASDFIDNDQENEPEGTASIFQFPFSLFESDVDEISTEEITTPLTQTLLNLPNSNPQDDTNLNSGWGFNSLTSFITNLFGYNEPTTEAATARSSTAYAPDNIVLTTVKNFFEPTTLSNRDILNLLKIESHEHSIGNAEIEYTESTPSLLSLDRYKQNQENNYDYTTVKMSSSELDAEDEFGYLVSDAKSTVPSSYSENLPVYLETTPVLPKTTLPVPLHRKSTTVIPPSKIIDHWIELDANDSKTFNQPPPSILYSLNELKKVPKNVKGTTREVLALSKSICSAATSQNVPKSESIAHILQKCALLKFSGLL